MLMRQRQHFEAVDSARYYRNQVKEMDVLKFPENKELLANFKKYRNHLSNTIKRAKESYFRSKIEQNKCNNTLLWECIKEVTNRNKKKVEI
nr:unnamed protein product [Callosobruchus analis]